MKLAIVVGGLLISSMAFATADDSKKVCQAYCLGVSPSMELVGMQVIEREGKSSIESFNRVAGACQTLEFDDADVRSRVLAVSYRLGNKMIGHTEIEGKFLRSVREANLDNCQKQADSSTKK